MQPPPVGQRSFSGLVLDNRMICLKHNNAFFQIFKQPLRKYWTNNITGFDLAKFDDQISKSGERPFLDVVAEKWGMPAATLVKELVCPPDHL